MASESTSLRDWVDAYWEKQFEITFEEWAAFRIERGATAKGMSREISAMLSGKAGVTDNTLRSWFPGLRADQEDRATEAVAS